MTEILRRVVLVTCLTMAVGFGRYAKFGEYFVIHKIDESHLRSGGLGMWGMSSEERARLKSLPLKELVREREHGPLITAKSGELKSFFKEAMDAFDGTVSDKWKKGAVFSVGDLNELWLKKKDVPVKEIGEEFFKQDQDQIVLAESESDTEFLRVRRQSVTAEDYSPFVGFNDAPPFKMLYPFCTLSLLITGAGFLFYFLFPWTKPIPDSLYTRKWQVVMIDIVAAMLFFAFFVLGWFLAGPTSLPPNRGWLIAGIIWLLCLGGLYLFEQGVFYALFNLKAEEDGLRVRTVQGEAKIAYSDIEKVEGAVLKNPRWLTMLLSLAAVFGKGAQSALAGGQALTMGSASYPGIAFTLKKGGKVYIWGSPSGDTEKHMEQFYDGLKAFGVALGENPVEVRGLGTEPRFDKAAKFECGPICRHPVLTMIASPFIGMIFMYLIAVFL